MEFKMNGELHSRAVEGRSYLLRKANERGLISVEGHLELARVDIDTYVDNREENLLKTVRVAARHRETKKQNEFNNQKNKKK